MKKKIRILHLEDEPADAELVNWELKKAKLDYEILQVNDKTGFKNGLLGYEPDIILSDHSLAAFDSHLALRMTRAAGLDVPFILVTATMSDEFAAAIMKEGADDYILKDRLSRLPTAVLNAISNWEVKKEQQKNEKLYRALIDQSADMKSLQDKDGNVFYTSPSMTKILGFSFEEFSSLPAYHFIHPDDLNSGLQELSKILDAPGRRVYLQHRLLCKDGTYIWCEGNITNMLHDVDIQALVSNFRDISDRKINEQKLLKANRLYAFISAINQSIVHITIEQELLDKVCEIASKTGGFVMSYIAMSNPADQLVMMAVRGDADSAKEMLWSSLDLQDASHNNVPAIRAFKSAKYVLNADLQNDPIILPWRERLIKYGIHSVIALPIVKFGKVTGVFSLFSKVKDFFDEQEIALLEEATTDVAFALENFEKERRRQQAEQTLIQSESKLNMAQQIAHIGHWELDLTKKVAIWSIEACRIYGLSPEKKKHTFKEWLSFVHADDLEYVKEQISFQKSTLKPISFEHRIVRKDGLIRFVYHECSYEFDQIGSPTALYGIVHDVTERQRNEEKIRYSELKMKEAQSLAHVGNFEIDILRNEMYWSDEQYNIMGYATDEAMPDISDFLSLVHAGNSENVTDQFLSLFKNFENSANEFSLMLRNGIEKMIYCKWGFEFDSNQMPVRLFGIMQDVTDKKLIEQNLAKSEAKLNEAQALAHIGSFEISVADYSVYWSDEQFYLMGFEPGEIVPTRKLFLEVVHPQDRDALKNALNKAFQTFGDEFIHFRLLRRNGSILNVYSEWKFEFDLNNKPVRLFGIVQDITERKKIEEKLRSSELFNIGVLNSLSSHIAVINKSGVIISVNEAWKKFATDNGETTLQRTGVGSNYFQVCEKSAKAGEIAATQTLKGMKSVLSGESPLFYLEYPCHSPEMERWFGLRVMKFDSDEAMIVVAHENITNVKRAEQERDAMLHELEDRVEERTKELGVKNKGIMDSINYAKRIQVSLLTPESQLANLFPTSFIFSQPSEVISGDFFWCYQRRNKKFIVVADCTGHGVPGGLMSMIGNNLLNQIVIEEHVENPTEILEILDTRLWAAVKGDMDEVRDGMDIALCIIDTHFKELYFAGALRPLFVASKGGAIEEVTGNRYPIGGGSQQGSKHFDTKRFPIIPGQRIYLTSDGYYSQFGGVKGKKFMKARFKKMLEEIQIQPMDQQEKLIREVLTEWTGSNAQVDDVLVVGIEL